MGGHAGSSIPQLSNPEVTKAPLFHVKQFAYRVIEVNIYSLFTDAEFPEDLVENIFDIDAPQQAANCL